MTLTLALLEAAEPDAIATILDNAAELLERDGWTQGQFSDSHGCYCAVGALGHVTGTNPIYTRSLAFKRAKDALAAVIDPNVGPLERQAAIVNWNDDTDRTMQQVVDTMRTAAATVRAQAS